MPKLTTIHKRDLYAQLGNTHKISRRLFYQQPHAKKRAIIRVILLILLFGLIFPQITLPNSWTRRTIDRHYQRTMQAWERSSATEQENWSRWRKNRLKAWQDAELLREIVLVDYLELPRSRHIQDATATKSPQGVGRDSNITVNKWQDETPDVVQALVKRAESDLRNGLTHPKAYRAQRYIFGDVAIYGDMLHVDLTILYQDGSATSREQTITLYEPIKRYAYASPEERHRIQKQENQRSLIHAIFPILFFITLFLGWMIYQKRYAHRLKDMLAIDAQIRTGASLEIPQTTANAYFRWLKREIQLQQKLCDYLDDPQNRQHDASATHITGDRHSDARDSKMIRTWESEQPTLVQNMVIYAENHLLTNRHSREEEITLHYPALTALSSTRAKGIHERIDAFNQQFYLKLNKEETYHPKLYTFSAHHINEEANQLIIEFLLEYGIEAPNYRYYPQQRFTLYVDLYHLTMAKRYLALSVS
ncbi:hypothetical protein [Entomospira culicis]|uniref:Uncharacterized protein n=1 Tax=Entomospira culicis TaxID=2719989 RepID=A0A968GFP2_9SPIO|nr:hypothetical protein [Entomospira culicis]NIZ18741.1 hypothetical protein [Entomospira culicis]NIZ68956.1 hypothetical protein [Entomospira culicis]WDI37548.1 hypothetical protein PVA46_01810 [Entomospira culicis]WDI39176.1 hypothetical protein PVA47_01815 [Entomospira culicis]